MRRKLARLVVMVAAAIVLLGPAAEAEDTCTFEGYVCGGTGCYWSENPLDRYEFALYTCCSLGSCWPVYDFIPFTCCD